MCVAKTMIIVGVLLFIGSVAWWYVYYEQFLGMEVKQASECFYYTTDICALSAMAEPISSFPAYSPVMLWASAALVVVGILLVVLAPRRN